MRAFDVHQHLWPEAFTAALGRRRQPPCLDGRVLRLPGEVDSVVDVGEHDLAVRLALLDRHGLDVALVSVPPGYMTDRDGELADAYHTGVLELVGASSGRIQALAAGVCRDGFVGACVAAADLVAGIDPLLVELREARQLLFVHPGPPRSLPTDAPPWWSAVVDYTGQMQAAYATWLARDATRFSDLPVIFAILAGGAPIQLERMRSRGLDDRSAIHANVFFDTSSYGRRALDLCLATYGVTQLVHGSDVPVIDPAPTLDAIRGFGDAVETMVLRENPRCLLERVRSAA
jgi:hypothetical protein